MSWYLKTCPKCGDKAMHHALLMGRATKATVLAGLPVDVGEKLWREFVDRWAECDLRVLEDGGFEFGPSWP